MTLLQSLVVIRAASSKKNHVTDDGPQADDSSLSILLALPARVKQN